MKTSFKNKIDAFQDFNKYLEKSELNNQIQYRFIVLFMTAL